MKEKNKNFSSKEIGIALNNATAAAFGSQALKGLSEGRKRVLRGYLGAILDGILEHRKEGLISAEELVATMVAGAMFVHVLLVAKATENKLATYQDLAAAMAEDLNEKA